MLPRRAARPRGAVRALLRYGGLGAAAAGAAWLLVGALAPAAPAPPPPARLPAPPRTPRVATFAPLPALRGPPAAEAAAAACECGPRRGDRGVVYWHISKAAGTTMCLMALQNGEVVQTDTKHESYASGECSETYGAYEREETHPGRCHHDCSPPTKKAREGLHFGDQAEQAEALRASLEQEGLTFIAPEKQMSPHGWEPPASVLSVIVLREPKARMVSQYGQKLKVQDSQWNTKVAGSWLHMPEFPEPPPDLLTFLHIYYRAGFQDNYMIRYLLGLRNVEHVVTAADLEAAKAVLRDKLDLVLVTERLDEAGCLFKELGWKPEVPRANVKAPAPSGGAPEAAAPKPEDEPAVAALLEELNEFDPHLYAYAVELFEEQLAACQCCERREVGAGEHWGA